MPEAGEPLFQRASQTSPEVIAFFASISKTQISRRLTLSIGNIRQRGPIAGAEMAIKETLNFRSPKSGV